MPTLEPLGNGLLGAEGRVIGPVGGDIIPMLLFPVDAPGCLGIPARYAVLYASSWLSNSSAAPSIELLLFLLLSAITPDFSANQSGAGAGGGGRNGYLGAGSPSIQFIPRGLPPDSDDDDDAVGIGGNILCTLLLTIPGAGDSRLGTPSRRGGCCGGCGWEWGSDLPC